MPLSPTAANQMEYAPHLSRDMAFTCARPALSDIALFFQPSLYEEVPLRRMASRPGLEMKNALIHIGSGKTGSSSIQAEMKRLQSDGKLGDIVYPLFGQRSNQNQLTLLFLPRERQPREIRGLIENGEMDYVAARDRLRESFAKYCSENTSLSQVLSGRGLSAD